MSLGACRCAGAGSSTKASSGFIGRRAHGGRVRIQLIVEAGRSNVGTLGAELGVGIDGGHWIGFYLAIGFDFVLGWSVESHEKMIL